MISGGRLRWRAQVLKASTAVDSMGRRTSTFSNGSTLRVDMRESGAIEQQYADGIAVVGTWEVRARWPDIARTTLTSLDRLVVRGKTLRIEGFVNLDERDRVAVLQCREVE